MTEDSTRCKETRAALSAYMADTLDPEKAAALEAHVSVCEACHVALEEAQERYGEAEASGGEACAGVQLELPEYGSAPVSDSAEGNQSNTISIVVRAIALLILVAAITIPLFQRPETVGRQKNTTSSLKQWRGIMEMYAAESPGHVFPPLSPYGGEWSVNIETIYPKFLTMDNVDLFVNPSVPDADILSERVSVAFAQETVDYASIARIAARNFVYLGYVVRDLNELAQFAQGVLAYAPAQRVDGIPTETGGLLPRLREGVERFYVTDVEDEAAAERIAATIPVMFEIPYPEGHPSHQALCHVLYLDGHVATVPYGDGFPALGEVAKLMKAAGALR